MKMLLIFKVLAQNLRIVRLFFKHMPEDDKHVKVNKRQRQDILRFRANVRKLMLGSIGT